MLMIRASTNVRVDGKSFTAPSTLELTFAGSNAPELAVPKMATGTKLAADAMGTPVMAIAQLFATLQAAATPAP
jgi:hypothetical protein